MTKIKEVELLNQTVEIQEVELLSLIVGTQEVETITQAHLMEVTTLTLEIQILLIMEM